MKMLSTDPRAVGARVRMALPSLTPLEAKVVESIFQRKNFDETTSLKEVAIQAGVSEAMVTKISKKLGFDGFREFRGAVAEYVRLPTADLHQDVTPEDSSEEIVKKVFRSSMQALEETLAILDIDSFNRAVDILYRAYRRDFYGVGGSAQIARDVSHKFLRIGLNSTVYDDAHMMLMSAALLGPDDAVIGFSHSGATIAVIDAVTIARKQGARTIAVTSYANSPLAEVSDVVLVSTSRGSPLLGENAAARIAQLNILDAVFVAVAQRDLDAAERNLAKTMGAVSNKRLNSLHRK